MNMHASGSGHPAQEELLAYGDGGAPAAVVAHVRTCSMCTTRARNYAATQIGLRRALYRFDCPDAHILGEYQLDLLDPEHRSRVAAHVLECDACAAELQTLRNYLALPTPVAGSAMQSARRLVATLFQPAAGLAYGGLRGTVEVSSRVFQVEDVTVSVGPGQGRGTLIGLVLMAGRAAQDLAGRAVRLVPTDRGALSSTLDDLGNFEFADVPAGMYALEIELPNALIVVIEELRLD